MIKRILYILLCIAGIAFAVYKISGNVIGEEVDKANFRAVELYANAIKLATLSINDVTQTEIDYKSIKVATKVECETINVSYQTVELRKCSVEGSKKKYKYINGKASRD